MSPYANGHLQATGRDARGRKQYRYHPEWRAQRDAQKFDRLTNLAEGLPTLRRWVASRLTGEVGEQDTAIAAVLALIDRAALRPGHPEYVRENDSYGATTLLSRHVEVKDHTVTLSFTAKGGKKVSKSLQGKRLARVLHASADLPGPDLFSYFDADGQLVCVRPEHLIETLNAVCGVGVTPKSLRTWAGTHAAFIASRDVEGELTIKAMADAASDRLDNTPSIARNSYIHPQVLDLASLTPGHRKKVLEKLPKDGPSELRQGEAALSVFLKG
nr:DNA topoisomerase IB [Ruegeria atlantica]